MQAVLILRLLARHRVLVGLGVVVALALAVFAAYRVSLGLPPTFQTRHYHVGVASAEVLVDSHSSQVIDLGGGAVRTDIVALTARARLMANIMAASPMKDQIARRAGLDPATFFASGPSVGADAGSQASLERASADPRANVMTIYFNETLPIITADAQAADAATATRISSAAVAVLGEYLKSVAAADKVPDVRQLVVEPLGPARSATVERGGRRLWSVLAFLFAFGVWCGAIVAVSRFAETWRAAAAAEASTSSRRSTARRDTPREAEREPADLEADEVAKAEADHDGESDNAHAAPRQRLLLGRRPRQGSLPAPARWPISRS